MTTLVCTICCTKNAQFHNIIFSINVCNECCQYKDEIDVTITKKTQLFQQVKCPEKIKWVRDLCEEKGLRNIRMCK